MELYLRLSPIDYGLDQQTITCVTWSPGGGFVSTGDREGSQVVWDVQSGNMVQHLPSDRGIEDCEWSPNGSYLVNASGSILGIWDPEEGLPIDRLEGIGGRIKGLGISPDSTRVASWAAGEKIAQIWSTVTNEHLLGLPHADELDWLAWSPDSSAVATSIREDLVQVWDVSAGEPVADLSHDGIILDFAWSPDGLLLAVGHSEGLTIWDARTWSDGPYLTFDVGGARSIEWSPDGTLLALVNPTLGFEIWNIPSETLVYSLATIGAYPKDMSWSPDGRWLAAGFNNSMVTIWDMTTGVWVGLGRHPVNDVNTVAWSPDSEFLASADASGEFYLWQIEQ